MDLKIYILDQRSIPHPPEGKISADVILEEKIWKGEEKKGKMLK
jgi:hypothetical protein